MAQQLPREKPLAIELQPSQLDFDSTTIGLCLSLFPWAEFRNTKATVKMHMPINLRGIISTFVAVTIGKVYNVRMLSTMPITKKAIYTMDRGYVDFARLYAFHQQSAFYFVQAKDDLCY